MEVEKGLRLRLAPQGITGTSYLEMDYVEPPPAGAADRLDAGQRLHPERAVDGDRDRQRRAGRSWSGCTSSTSRRRWRASTSCSTRPTTASRRVDIKRLQQRAETTLAKLDTTLDDLAGEEDLRRGDRAADRAAPVERRAQEDARRTRHCRRCRKTRPPRRAHEVRKLVAIPSSARRSRNIERITGPLRPHLRRRRHRPRDARSRTCARSPTTCATSPRRRSVIRRT